MWSKQTMVASEIATYISLGLSVLFWLLSSKQANDARKTLDDIKSAIINWQSELNASAINIISSRPEVIAKETAMAETQSMSEFSSCLAELIEKSALTKPDTDIASSYQLEVLNKLLDHHKNLILGKQQLMNQALALQTGNHSTKTEPKPIRSNE
jgi:hypothetical protein